jgi:AcrR family transcriptional regulator
LTTATAEIPMARPKSDDKRNAILAAATQVVAEQGVGAPTATIAKVAGVAEGTLFTYFATKDELLNRLYLELKAELADTMLPTVAKTSSSRNMLRHSWQQYVRWGVSQPAKRKVLAQLGVSDRISEQSKAAGMHAFTEVNAMLQESIASGALRDQPPTFAGAIMASLAETTMDFMARDPARADDYAASGFEAFWNAIASK